MTLAELNEICKTNNIKDDVKLLSDSGWECWETEMNGVWYSEIDHAIVFTQNPSDNYNGSTMRGRILTYNQTFKKLK